MEDLHSFNINVPIPRVCAKSSTIRNKQSQFQSRLKKNMLKKPQEYSESFLTKYTAPQKHPLKVKIIQKEEVLLPYMLYAKKEERIKHKYELNVTLQQKYKMKLCEYRNRLRVQNPLDDVAAVTDTDEGFFKYVNGRSLINRSPIYKTLKTVLTHQLRTKQEVGYRNDTILNIELNNRHEMKAYEQSFEMFTAQTKCLHNFVSEDYCRSISLVRQCDQFENNLAMKLIDMQFLADKQFTIISSLMSLDYMYYLQQRYGRFLYYLSPPTWRAQNRKFATSMEIEVNGFDLGGGDEETFIVVFDKMQKECFSDLVSPALYFTHPDELIKLFEGIEKQQLNYLEYLMHLAPLIRQAKEECKVLKNQLDQDSAYVKSTIKTLEILLDYSEEQCAQLEMMFYKIINGLFYESVGAPHVIKLFYDLEFCYEQLFSETPLNTDLVTIAKCLETYYMDYWKRLEELDADIIKEAVKQTHQTECELFRRAKRARKELFVYRRLEKGLRLAFAPPPSKQHECVENKVEEAVPQILRKPIISKKQKKQSKTESRKAAATRKTLSDAELEYLALFTDWTQEQDPAKYLHSE